LKSTLILGLFTRLVAIWLVTEFAITGAFGVLNGSIPLLHDYALCAGALVLLVYGIHELSVDRLLEAVIVEYKEMINTAQLFWNVVI